MIVTATSPEGNQTNREHEAVEADCNCFYEHSNENLESLRLHCRLVCSQSSVQPNTGDVTISTVTVSLKNLDTSQNNTCITAESPRPDCNECWIFINLVYYCNITTQSARRAHSYDWPFCQIMLSPLAVKYSGSLFQKYSRVLFQQSRHVHARASLSLSLSLAPPSGSCKRCATKHLFYFRLRPQSSAAKHSCNDAKWIFQHR